MRVVVLTALLLSACAQSGSPSPDLKPATPDGPAADRAADRGVRPIQLPADESPHSDPEEWYYYTGRLVDSAGAVYGFELVVFQVVIAGKPIYISHHAITDLQKQSFTHAMKTSFVDQRAAAKEGFSFDVGGWKMSGHAGKDQLSAALPGYALELALVTAKPPVNHYGTGWMHIGSPQPFYYYSYTRMTATGKLTVDGKQLSVTGEAWMDHQWGEIGGLGKDYDGWDWFSLRLDDGFDAMIFVVRGSSGFSGGTAVDATGAPRPLAAGDFTITATGQWLSPTTGGTYPQGWTIKVPAVGLDLTVTPLLADQEVSDRYGWLPLYWEGMCALTGTRDGQPAKGTAYVELTGYAQ